MIVLFNPHEEGTQE